MFYKFLKNGVITTVMCCCSLLIIAQNNTPYFKDALATKRAGFYNKMVASVQKNMALPLNAINEAAWVNSLNTLNLIKYKNQQVTNRLQYAASNLKLVGTEFWHSFLDLINSDYPSSYLSCATFIYANSNNDMALKAKALHYLMQAADSAQIKSWIQNLQRIKNNSDSIIINEILFDLQQQQHPTLIGTLQPFFDTNYLPQQMLVISLQRKNRNYPGIAIVRNPNGQFIKNDDSTYFSVPQLTRSASNMPSYISLGNTPQGIFKITGFDVSKSYFIGPTTNIQLSMPFEYCKAIVNEQLVDTTFTLEQYCNLLPKAYQNYHPLYGTYIAGKAGRNEIIAHGTTIDAEFYKNEPYYPLTPTAGCLATTEFWSNSTGYVEQSDQIKLTQAVLKAGGPKGYLIVIEIDDEQKAVTLNDIKKYLK